MLLVSKRQQSLRKAVFQLSSLLDRSWQKGSNRGGICQPYSNSCNQHSHKFAYQNSGLILSLTFTPGAKFTHGIIHETRSVSLVGSSWKSSLEPETMVGSHRLSTETPHKETHFSHKAVSRPFQMAQKRLPFLAR